MKELQGTGVALITPFDKELKIDYESLEKVLTHTAQGGVDYWVVQGTTGESITTSAAEKKAILNFIKTHNPKKLPIVYGLGGSNTADLLDQIHTVEWNNVDAMLSVSPYYNRPSQEGMLAHYQKLATEAPVPVLLYNVPARTGANLSYETTLQLSKLPNIIGIKEASTNLSTAIAILKDKPSDFLVIAGDDALTLPLIALGAVGVISTIANALPKEMNNLVKACQTGNYPKARTILATLWPFLTYISQQGNPVATKQLVATLGICQRHVRLPLVPLDDQATQKSYQLMNNLNLDRTHSKPS